jgi:hypothetical protein
MELGKVSSVWGLGRRSECEFRSIDRFDFYRFISIDIAVAWIAWMVDSVMGSSDLSRHGCLYIHVILPTFLPPTRQTDRQAGRQTDRQTGMI